MKQVNKVNVLEKISSEMREVLCVQKENAIPISPDSDNSTIRLAYIEERKYWNRHGPQMMKTIHEKVMTAYGEIETRIYYPNSETSAVIFYLHGGGFIVGNLDTHDRIMRLLA
ncbi:alpha/beta hydrolase fold domain-containing protein, partial [Escherichia coli]|uniref:alpha/beta hydrolase fold domain-containing protein n=2 Tax=Enterobacterales TaxID=91347 RepID=UPI001CC824B5